MKFSVSWSLRVVLWGNSTLCDPSFGKLESILFKPILITYNFTGLAMRDFDTSDYFIFTLSLRTHFQSLISQSFQPWGTKIFWSTFWTICKWWNVRKFHTKSEAQKIEVQSWQISFFFFQKWALRHQMKTHFQNLSSPRVFDLGGKKIVETYWTMCKR